MRRALILVALIVAGFARPAFAAPAWTTPPPPADAPADVKAVLQKADPLYYQRNNQAAQDEELRLLRELAAKYPNLPYVQWRLSRILFWVAEATPDKETHRALGQEGWDAGKKALAVAPDSPEALYYTAICIGEVAHSVGILTALSKGLEGSFRDPLLKAEKINPKVDNGGIYRALGRYRFELPWPKRDLDASVSYLRKAMEINPGDLRARYYLAETLQKRDNKGDVDEAKRLLQEVESAPIGTIDPPEDMRAKHRAREVATRFGWR